MFKPALRLSGFVLLALFMPLPAIDAHATSIGKDAVHSPRDPAAARRET